MQNKIPVDQLQKIVGKDNLRIESERIFASPENSQAASEIVKLAGREKFKLLPLGSGSILDWSKVSSPNTVFMKSERLNQVVKVVPEDLYVILQAGFPLKELNGHLESFNLFYPLADGNPPGTVGGSVATNLKGRSGNRSIQTREFVLAVEMADPEGRVLNLGARTFKSVTGYDLPRLFTGSWGTLGFISQISLRLLPGRKRKDYPGMTLDPTGGVEMQRTKDLRATLSLRIKQALDPKGVFLGFDSLD